MVVVVVVVKVEFSCPVMNGVIHMGVSKNRDTTKS